MMSDLRTIPFNRPFVVGKELDYIAQAVRQGNLGGEGSFTQRCCRFLETRYGMCRVLLTPSCTTALEIAAQLCELGPGDEVILPAFTFVSTANAVARLGARPVFVDIREDTLNLDERLVERAMTPQTKAIFAVHYAGVACEPAVLASLARAHQVRLVEDAAQGLESRFDDRPLGTWGDLATFSFHETKNVHCGQGGALCVNDPALVERAEYLHDKGTDRARFRRGEVAAYRWVDLGTAGVPSELTAAFLWAQLEHLETISRRRRTMFEYYALRLAPLEQAGHLRLPRSGPRSAGNYHLFYLLLADRAQRDALLASLAAVGIHAVFHYVPLHTSPVGARWGYRAGDLPWTESLSERLLRLPLFFEMTTAEQDRVVDAVAAFFRHPR